MARVPHLGLHRSAGGHGDCDNVGRHGAGSCTNAPAACVVDVSAGGPRLRLRWSHVYVCYAAPVGLRAAGADDVRCDLRDQLSAGGAAAGPGEVVLPGSLYCYHLHRQPADLQLFQVRQHDDNDLSGCFGSCGRRLVASGGARPPGTCGQKTAKSAATPSPTALQWPWPPGPMAARPSC